MDPSIQWNITLCSLTSPGTPFLPAGMSSICPLKTVTVFVLQLTQKANYNSAEPSIYLPLSYDALQNSLCVFIPPRMEMSSANSLPYLNGIDEHLRRFCEQFKSGNSNCVIYPAISDLVSIQNLLCSN